MTAKRRDHERASRHLIGLRHDRIDAAFIRTKTQGPRMTSAPGPEIRLNGVRYCWPDRPVVVVCNDGGDPAYFDRALKDGIVPNVARFMETGFSAIAQCVIPSFTCPNNVSIVTGSPPSIHGISGNFYLEPETGNAVVMTGPELMRSTTILAEFSRKGAKVASITAKDKLRQQLGKDMNIAGGCINFSSEKADKCNKRENGIENVLELVGMPLPDIYSPELSLFVLEAGIRLLETEKPLILYLSLTDYIQHKYAPGEPEADRYYRDMDALFGRLHQLGAVVGLVADHGMHDKSNPDGSLKVVWLQDALDLEFGKGATPFIHGKTKSPRNYATVRGLQVMGVCLCLPDQTVRGPGVLGSPAGFMGGEICGRRRKSHPRKVSHGGEDRPRQRGTGRGGSMRTREGRGRGGTGLPHPLANPRRPWEGLLQRNSPHAGMLMRCTCKKSPGSALNQGSPFLSEPEQLADNGTARQ